MPRLQALVARQRDIAQTYAKALDVQASMICHEPSGSNYNRYLFPVAFASRSDRDTMSDHLRRAGVDTMKYGDEFALAAASHHGYGGDCPAAEALCSRVLVIPGYHSLGPGDVQHIVKSFNLGVAAARRPSRAVTV
jgi:dTDP-4-amino-4,6-dideoxygalactose transaminase